MAVDLGEVLSLLRSQHSLLEKVATGEESIPNVNAAYVQRRDRLVPALRHASIEDPFPWRDLWQYWDDEARPQGTYARRRSALRARIAPAEDRCLQAPNDEGGIEDWSDDDVPPTWEHTLQRLRSMKVVFDRAVELDDFQDVARRCREIIIEATDLVHEPWMVPADEEPPKKSDAKNRMDQICAKLLVGPTYEHVRGVLKKTLALAQYVTHGSNVTRLEALAAAQSTLMVVLTLRELQRLARELAEVEESDSALGPDEDFADYAAEYWHQGGAEDDSEDPPDVQLHDQTGA